MEKFSLPQEVIEAQKRVRPLYDMLEERSVQTWSPLRILIDECVDRARPNDTPELPDNKV